MFFILRLIKHSRCAPVVIFYHYFSLFQNKITIRKFSKQIWHKSQVEQTGVSLLE
jgi:hypothetical protein